MTRPRFAAGAAATGLVERDGRGEERGRRLVAAGGGGAASPAMGSSSESTSSSSSCVPDPHACVSPP